MIVMFQVILGILLLFFTSVCCSESSDSDVIAPLKVKSGMIINAVAFDHIHKRRYAAGYFAKTLDHTGKYGYEHGFISQVDYEGTVNWTHRITSVHDHRITDLVIDESNGDIFAVGTTYIDETDLEKNHLGGRTDSFLARLSSSGERLYLYKYGSAGDDYALKVSYFKSENNLFIAGTTNGTGTITVLQPGASSVATKPLAIEYPDFQMISQVAIAGKLSFLYIGTKFTENGTRAVVGHESMQGVIKWQTEIPGKGSYYGKGIDVLFSSHTVIVTGYKESEQLDDHENGYAFVAALRLSDGRILWIKTFGDNQGDVANSVAVSQRLSYIFNVGSEYQAASNLTVGYLRIFDHTGQALRTSYFDYTKQFEANISSFGLDVDVSDGDAKYAVAGYGQSGVDDYYSFLSFSQLKLIELPRTNPPKPIQRTSLVKTVYSGQSNRAQELTIVATVSTLSALVWVVLIICLYRIHSAKRDRLVQQQESLIQTRIKSRNRFRHRFGYTPYAIPMHNLAPPGIIMPVGSHNQQEPLPIQKSSHIRLE
ncbi:hypothetical protein MP638_000453 [Amoeboaphelidium occidentale]|nr:hypothetical protein MP638_000453 [Amoeboaphelidium occidentale]